MLCLQLLLYGIIQAVEYLNDALLSSSRWWCLKFSFSPVTLNNRLLFVLETEVDRCENMNKVHGAERRGGEAKPLGKYSLCIQPLKC